jgi:hypothetical protein
MEAENHLNNIYNFSSYCKENTRHLHNKDQIMLFKKIIIVYSETDSIKSINALREQNSELLNGRAGFSKLNRQVNQV